MPDGDHSDSKELRLASFWEIPLDQVHKVLDFFVDLAISEM
jgi:hypothetical protein